MIVLPLADRVGVCRNRKRARFHAAYVAVSRRDGQVAAAVTGGLRCHQGYVHFQIPVYGKLTAIGVASRGPARAQPLASMALR